MKIKQISVTGLFGIFDHVIPLNRDERITIIHGPNGFGKTAILRMLNGLFKAEYSVFRTIPFSKFQVDFDNGISVAIVKTLDDLQGSKNKEDITVEFYELGQEKISFPLINSPSDLDFPIDALTDMMPDLRRVGAKKWRYMRTGEILDLNDIIDRFGDVLPSKLKLQGECEWKERLPNDIHLHLIESQRLLNISPGRASRVYMDRDLEPPVLPTVSDYSKELAKLIKDTLTKYGTTSQSLDRTFPARVMKQTPSHGVTDEDLRDQIGKLEERRSRIIEAGLLDKDENSDFQIQTNDIDESTKNILSVYVMDIEQKLNVFSEVTDKLDLFRRIINKKFAYSYKEINFNKEKGFVFKTLYPSDSKKNTLSPKDLSSGEQHELVLLYELLFKVKANSLVLIDEPELSLHVGWQSQFLEDIQEITKLADLDILMATHSPDIIQDRWDLTVGLKGPEK